MGDTSPNENDEAIDYDNPPFPLGAADRELIAMRDEDFHEITWDDLKAILARNTLADLKRRPSDLRRYLAWSHRTKQNHGGLVPFVISQRLFWQPTSGNPPNAPPTFSYQSSIPFAHPSDFAVLLNDWPYGFAPGITHLLVWSKTPIAVDLASGGDVTAEARGRIEEFVREFFVRDLESFNEREGEGLAGGARVEGKGSAGERVLWFKNWVALQSVRGVDHVHVLVRDAPRALVEKWTRRRDL